MSAVLTSETGGCRCAGTRSAPGSATSCTRATDRAIHRALFEDALGGLGEGGHALGAALLGEGGAAGPRELAVGEGQLAGFGEGDEPGGAEAEFAASSADDEPLDAASGSGRHRSRYIAVSHF